MTERRTSRGRTEESVESLRYATVLKEHPERVANQVIEKTGQHSPPVDLVKCLEYLGRIEVIPESLDKDGYLVEFWDGSAEMLIKRESFRTRRWRFSVAHELAHWILNRFTDSEVAPVSAVRGASHKEIEGWSDKFAAALIMPREWIRAFVGPLGNTGRAEVILEGPNVFDASQESFYCRLHEVYRVVIAQITKSRTVIIYPSFYQSQPDAVSDAYERESREVWEILARRVSPENWKDLDDGNAFVTGPVRIAFPEMRFYRFGGRTNVMVIVGRPE